MEAIERRDGMECLGSRNVRLSLVFSILPTDHRIDGRTRIAQPTNRNPLFTESGTLELGIPLLLNSVHSHPQIHFTCRHLDCSLRFQNKTVQLEAVCYRIDDLAGR